MKTYNKEKTECAYTSSQFGYNFMFHSHVLLRVYKETSSQLIVAVQMINSGNNKHLQSKISIWYSKLFFNYFYE